MLTKFFKLTVAALFLVIINGCASPSKSLNMTVFRENPPVLNTPLEKNIKMSDVSGGQWTNPLWASKVDNENLKTAIRESLKQSNLLGKSEDSKYKLSATLVSLDQPLIGATLTVVATITYKLTEIVSNNEIWSKTITAQGECTMGESFFAVRRLRLANEYAVKNNIKILIDKLINLKIETKNINV